MNKILNDVEKLSVEEVDAKLKTLELVVAAQGAMITALLKELTSKSPSSLAVITDIVRTEIARFTEPESDERAVVHQSAKKVFDSAFETSQTLNLIKASSSH
ncbi:hypothetical protein [Serratia liquefaciens]|uniref:hypothetical protein n=1 Tax=Serratia liquefaciens TaxID=614 RepID=UPI00061B7345|nr:hypothetical protein [Serratia liquefaciens]AKE10939.1 hypothetical protein XJ20_13995 [Serratia liquefaciens]